MPLIKHLLVALLLAMVCACSGQPAERTAETEMQAVTSTASQVDWAAMQAFWNRAMALPGIDTGPADASKRMVIYFDPHCPVCAKQWSALRPYLDQVRIHWVPVAYMDATSARQAAALLSAEDPEAALATNEQAFDFKTNKGGYRLQAEPAESVVAQITSNTQSAMKAGDLIGTPTLGFELMRDQRYYKMTGMLEADALRTAISDLGTTMDPWAKHAEQAASRPDDRVVQP